LTPYRFRSNHGVLPSQNLHAMRPAYGEAHLPARNSDFEALTGRAGNLAQRYSTHNLRRGRGFVYGGTERVQVMKSLLPESGGRALDLGCRDGALADALGLTRSELLVGIDIDMEAMRWAAERYLLRPIKADLWRDLPFRPQMFDLVIAGELLEHLPFPDKLVAEISRVLRPNGVLVGSVPNAFRLKNRLLFLMGQQYERDSTHLRQFSPESLHVLLEPLFDDVVIRPCVGRFSSIWPRMLGNDLVWRAVRRDRHIVPS